jgi:predicted PurR-regulated permease PerM
VAEKDQSQIEDPLFQDSPPWNRTTKIIVVVTALILFAAFARRFQLLLLQVAAAAIIAYVITPIIDFINRRSGISRGISILIVYSVVLLFLALALILFSSGLINQSIDLIDTVPVFVDRVLNRLATTPEINIGPYSLDMASFWEAYGKDLIEEQLIASIGSIANQGGRTLLQILSSTIEVAITFLFTVIISIYLAFEVPKLGGYVERAAQQPGYQADARRVNREFGRIWRAYLRGQIILGLIIFLAVWLALTLLGVQNAFVLGVLSGVLEFLPVIGPFIGTGAASISAFFQPTNYMGLDPWVYALLVIGVMFLIQQIENNLLVPRIVGGALDLHPLIVIIGVVIGASLAGLVGAVLAAPVLATAKLLGTYAWRKLFDLHPFPDPVEQDDSGFGWSKRVSTWWSSRRQVEASEADLEESGTTLQEEAPTSESKTD